MLETVPMSVASVAFIAAFGVAVHYAAGLDWPWAIVIGAAVAVALRWLLRSETVSGTRKPPLTRKG